MKEQMNFTIRFVNEADREFWFTLDKHLSDTEFDKKILSRQGYVLLSGEMPIGILRYNLFWDNTPFCNMLYISKVYQRQGFGRAMMKHWENEMKSSGYKYLSVSTQANEKSQYFYRKIGYRDCGELTVPDWQKELFLFKAL